MTISEQAEREAARIRESENTFYRRILSTVEGNEIPGMEAWNVDNAANLLRRMKAAYDASLLGVQRLEDVARAQGLLRKWTAVFRETPHPADPNNDCLPNFLENVAAVLSLPHTACAKYAAYDAALTAGQQQNEGGG